jgi:hypothetical protein
LSPVTTCKLIKTGANHTDPNDSRSETFIFGIYRYNCRTKKELTEDFTLLQLLQQNDIVVSIPNCRQPAEFCSNYQSTGKAAFAVLFFFYRKTKILSCGKEMHWKAGRLMTQIHSVSI